MLRIKGASGFQMTIVSSAIAAIVGGCIPLHRHPATNPATAPMATTGPTTEPVATSDLGTSANLPGLKPKPKPFIALPRGLDQANTKPSTLLLEHASPDSPVPLSDFTRQPLHDLAAFHLGKGLTSAAVQAHMGLPAQLADTEDPWWVYRLTGYRELWLHFSNGPAGAAVLDAADVIRSAEDGYVRDRVFSAD
jgi:hypothetical protein